MATKSFQTEFTFNQKTGSRLAQALDGSRKSGEEITKPVSFLKNKTDKNKIESILKDF